MAEVGDDVLDHLFQPVELGERGVDAYGAVGMDARHAGIVARIDDGGLADRLEHALVRRRVGEPVASAQLEIVVETHLFLLLRLKYFPISCEQIVHRLLLG